MMTSGPSLAPFRNCWSVSVIVLIGCTSTRAVCAAAIDGDRGCDSAANATNAVNLATRRSGMTRSFGMAGFWNECLLKRNRKGWAQENLSPMIPTAFRKLDNNTLFDERRETLMSCGRNARVIRSPQIRSLQRCPLHDRFFPRKRKSIRGLGMWRKCQEPTSGASLSPHISGVGGPGRT
jgi:hypothetical protein